MTVRIAAPRDVVFAAFTQDIDLWWRHGPRFRHKPASVMRLESKPFGRLYEECPQARGGQPRLIILGHVSLWEPPARLVLTYRPSNFGDEVPSTEVDVRFERAIGHAGEGTLVYLEHRGWAAVPGDHPVRHGMDVRPFVASIGRFWADLLGGLRERLVRVE